MRLWGARRSWITFLLGLAVSSGGWSAAGFLYLRDMGLNLRFRPVGELDSLLASGLLHTRPAGTPASQKAFLHLLEREGYPPGSLRTVGDAVRLQVWIGDRVPKLAVHPGNERGYDLLRLGAQGGGLACGAMTDILREALVLLGVPARAVVLSQSDFWLQTHAVVEAHLEGEWRVLDPTFNVTYEGERGAMGVAAIQDSLGRPGSASVRAVWHGPRRYPADLQRDAPDWQRYFASAYVYEIGTQPRSWRMLPPWRYWTGAAHYYFGRQQTVFPTVHDRFYFAVTVSMPILCIAAGLVACLLILRDWRAARPSSEGA